MKVRMVIIDKCGVRGDATLCIVIFQVFNFNFGHEILIELEKKTVDAYYTIHYHP